MSNTNTVPSILPSMDYHCGMYDFYHDSGDSFSENLQYPTAFYPSTHFEYPRPYLNQTNWEQSQIAGAPSALAGDQSLELLDLDSILAAYHGNEAEQPKSCNDFTRSGNQRQVGDQNVINIPEITSNWHYDLPAPLQMPPLQSSQPVYAASSAVPHVSSKTAPRKSNGAKGLKSFHCPACETWFTSSSHLKRHYSTSIHRNSVRTSGVPVQAAASVSLVRRPAGTAPRAPPAPPVTQTALAPHTLPPVSHLRGNQYTSGSLDISGTAAPEPQYTQVYLGQNHQHNTFKELQLSNHELVTGPERAKAGDLSVSLPPAAPSPHECRACGKRFSRACSLTQHYNSSHSGARLFKCAHCGKRFADEAACARHGARHVGRKPFGCAACPKSFNYKSDMRRHMCLHAADRPFACALCGKGFVRRDHMLKHVDTHAKRVTRDTSASSSSSSLTPPST